MSAFTPPQEWSDLHIHLPLAQEYVVGRIGSRFERACPVAGALDLATLGIDPLHGADAAESAVAARGRHLKLQPRNIVCHHAGRAANDFADHGAAVHMLPVRSGIVPADRLAADD